MRMTSFTLPWKHIQEGLREVGIDLSKLADIDGWFSLKYAAFSEGQRERVLATLPDEPFSSQRENLDDTQVHPRISHGYLAPELILKLFASSTQADQSWIRTNLAT